MRVGATIFNQNYTDWDRYEAEERGEAVAAGPARSDREIFREELEIARIADRSGFDSVWTIEHHFTPYTMVTNPLQYLTYIAGITENVDLGTMVVVLPWHNPVRVAEDVNMLDAFLGEGRDIILGVGRGLGRREFHGLSIDQNEARGRFDESLQVLKQLLSTGQCTFEGEHFQVSDVRLRPQLTHDLSANLWCAGGSPESVAVIAANDVNPLIIPTQSLDVSLNVARTYVRLRDAAGHGTSAHTKLALWTYVAETEDEARAGAEQYMCEYSDSALRHYEMLSEHLKTTKGYETYGAMSDLLRDNKDIFLRGFFDSHPWGTPEQTIARATELAEAFGTNEIMFVFKYGSMPIDLATRSMRLFAAEVMPALKALDPAPMSVEAASA
jgi:alkanesulfonate monooxygenase SsuD/methylene tetrahydromethanopterin reductase-like flavin-dependent oxidoreductase (luciferase family)